MFARQLDTRLLVAGHPFDEVPIPVTVVTPCRLRPGSTIGVAAVSGPVEQARLEAGIACLRRKGYSVVEAANLRRREGFLAGSDAERAAGYRELLRDPKVEAIFFARGGYGASRVLAHLDIAEIRANPKIHLGGSDLTALFAFLWRRAGLVTFYGPMVAVEMANGEEGDWEEVLGGSPPRPHRFEASEVIAVGRGEGPLVGGCLSLLASLAGTPEALSAIGSILFWEDVGEPLYRLDRMLTQLERSGTFNGLQGMVMGPVALPNSSRADSADALRGWLLSRFEAAPFPVAMGLTAGHLANPRTLPLGAPVRLDLENDSSLEFLGPGVEER